jgi:hypothetical protein
MQRLKAIMELCKEPPDALWKALHNLNAIKQICEQPSLESAAREIAREHWKQRLLHNLPDLKPHEVQKLMDDASEDIESWGELLERHLHSAAQPPKENRPRCLGTECHLHQPWPRSRGMTSGKIAAINIKSCSLRPVPPAS